MPRPIQPRGCKGRSPLHKKTKSLPLPRRGRGSGGWGSKASYRQGRQAAKKAIPPAGQLFRRVSPYCFRLRRGDARGEAPCIRKLKISPFPGGEGGRGDGGKKQSKRRGRAGGKQGKPPLRTPQWHGQSATSRTSPRRAREAHSGAMLYPKPKEACRKLQQASFRKRITPCRRCLRLRPERGDRPRPRCTQTSVRSWGSGDSPDQWKNQS